MEYGAGEHSPRKSTQRSFLTHTTPIHNEINLQLRWPFISIDLEHLSGPRVMEIIFFLSRLPDRPAASENTDRSPRDVGRQRREGTSVHEGHHATAQRPLKRHPLSQDHPSIKEAKELRKLGMTVDMICSKTGISRTSFYRFVVRPEEEGARARIIAVKPNGQVFVRKHDASGFNDQVKDTHPDNHQNQRDEIEIARNVLFGSQTKRH